MLRIFSSDVQLLLLIAVIVAQVLASSVLLLSNTSCFETRDCLVGCALAINLLLRSDLGSNCRAKLVSTGTVERLVEAALREWIIPMGLHRKRD